MKEKTGTHFEDDDDFTIHQCRDPEHNPPTHIVIPQGKKLVHICPSCKNRMVIRAESFSLKAETVRRPSHESAYQPAKTPRKNITNRGWC